PMGGQQLLQRGRDRDLVIHEQDAARRWWNHGHPPSPERSLKVSSRSNLSASRAPGGSSRNGALGLRATALRDQLLEELAEVIGVGLPGVAPLHELPPFGPEARAESGISHEPLDRPRERRHVARGHQARVTLLFEDGAHVLRVEYQRWFAA